MSEQASGSLWPYRLDELGWLQFDRLCELVLEAEASQDSVDWRGHSNSARVATVRSGLTLVSQGITLPGPVSVAALWIRNHGGSDSRLAELTARAGSLLEHSDPPVADHVLLVTNLASREVGAALRAQGSVGDRRLVVLGAEQLSAAIDRHAKIRSALPSLLGLRDLEPLIGDEQRDRSSVDLDRAQELARVFWATRAYHAARAILTEHRFVVLTGPPEMGKTAIGEMLALVKLTEGWEAHECTDPDQLWRAYDADRRQVFVADDAFGSTEYRPDAAERWAVGIGRILAALDDDHWLIWTSRPAPLKAALQRLQRDQRATSFPAPGQVLVDASHLDLSEKTVILFRHAKAHGVGGAAKALLRSAGLTIIEHPHFTPERIRRLVTDRLAVIVAADDQVQSLVELVGYEIEEPTEAMRRSFQALEEEHRDILIALLDAPAGLVEERAFAAAVRRHHPGGLSRSPAQLLDRLTDHFLRVTPLGIGWVHPSWRDLVIEQLRRDRSARQRFLSVCGLDGLLLALSEHGGPSGERELPLLREDADWDRLADRIRNHVRELEPGELNRLMLAMTATVRGVQEPSQRVEAQSIGRELLGSVRVIWDREHELIRPFLLDAWYQLREELPGVVAPDVAVTWAELHPGRMLLDRPDLAELMRADEWLAVAQTLYRHDLPRLTALGFLSEDDDLLEQLIIVLARITTEQAELRPLVQSVLSRIEDLVPRLAGGAQSALTISDLADDLDRKRWWLPEDIAAPPSTQLAVKQAEFTAGDVDRVLRDL